MERTILIVEDSRTQAERLGLLLAAEEYRVEHADNGREALDRIRSSPPDLIISDVMMPKMDGYELCHAVKSSKRTRHIPFVLLTSKTSPLDIVRGLERGADNFITKPFEDEYLLERVRRIFQQLDLRRSGRFEMEVTLKVGEHEIALSADKQQIIELLFSTFEELCSLNAKLEASRREVESYARTLEAKVEERTREFRVLFEGVPIGLARTAPDGRVLDANSAFVRLLGYPDRASLLERSAVEFYSDPEERSRRIERLEREETITGEEVQLRRRDGSVAWVRLSLHARRGSDHRVMSYEVAAEDISERKGVEDQLRQSQKMEAIGRLAGGVAHDFNNLLTVIVGRGHIVQRRLGAEDPSRRDVELIQQSAERAARLTRQLLAFSRKQVLEPKVVDLSRVVTAIEPLLRRLIGEDVRISIETQQGLGRVKADPGQIEQVILNLAINSRDAMPRGGRITVETANVELDEAYVARYPELAPGLYVILAVSDTGIGMDAAVQARLFEPFFTTKEPGKGTGLGLATVFGIVKQSGGHIAVYSEPGHGSTFKVYLPRVDDLPEAVDGGAIVAAPSRGSETLLLVEDEPELRALTSEVLRAWGYTVLEAGDPAEALQMAKRHQGLIHLIVTDVVMPGMSGREMADRLIADRPGVPILFVSGYTDAAIVHHGVLDPGTPFLPKPFTPDALTRKVREVLDQR